jgi:hypothetical protein
MSKILNSLNMIQESREKDRESLFAFSKFLENEIKKIDRKISHIAASVNGLLMTGKIV